MTQAAADALLLPLDELDRADMPRSVRDSLRKGIVAIVAAFGEDDDPHKVAPNPRSFTRLLRFLEHPYRWSWPAPAIAVDPEGIFSAVWDIPGVRRWQLAFSSDGQIEETSLETFPDGRIDYNHSSRSAADEIKPPFSLV